MEEGGAETAKEGATGARVGLRAASRFNIYQNHVGMVLDSMLSVGI